MLTLTRENFSTVFQNMLERYYLQPFTNNLKVNIKDGHVERTIHGAIHASRATLWTCMIHHVLKNILPETINASLETISSHIGLESEKVLLLVFMTIGCHDTGRRDEGTDYWDSDSAVIAGLILMESGLTKNTAELFVNAVRFKDNPENYIDFITTREIDKDKIHHFDYIRKLINLGDTLDIMRCVKQFKSEYLFRTLTAIHGFDESHHTVIMNLIMLIHEMIYTQGDMLYDCMILDLNNNCIAERPKRHLELKKAKCEHAENVLSAVIEDIHLPHEFTCYRHYFDIATVKKYEGFDAYIHGTNSAIFATLPNANFQLLSPLKLLKQHLLAPITGEFERGGYAKIHGRGIGHTSFGRLSSRRSYSLSNIICNYTQQPIATKSGSYSLLIKHVDDGLGKGFSNINLILIYLGQARQFGLNLPQRYIELLRLQLDAVRQFYYLMQLFGTVIFPNLEKINSSGWEVRSDVVNVIYNHLTFEHIIGRIMDQKIDIQAIIYNPSEENLQKALEVLELPKKSRISLGLGEAPEEIVLPDTQYFHLKNNGADFDCDLRDLNFHFDSLSINYGCWRINNLLNQYARNTLPDKYFCELGARAKAQVKALDKRIFLLNRLLDFPVYECLRSDVFERSLVEQKIPLILLHQDDSLVYAIDQEYRSHRSLSLGIEIKMIATDTHRHRLEIMYYLAKKLLGNIQVVLFQDLVKSTEDKTKPVSPYIHSDGMPTLKWLSAKKSAEYPGSFFKKSPSGEALFLPEKALDLMRDAMDYHNIAGQNQSRY